MSTEDHSVTTQVTSSPGGVRVAMSCTCGSVSSHPWPVATAAAVEWQALHLSIVDEQGKASLRRRMEREVGIVTCPHDTIAEAAGLRVCPGCGTPDPRRAATREAP